MNDSPILVHLGYHKTATTWLQNAIFSDETLGFVSPWGPQAGVAVDEFVLANGFRFDATRARSRFEEGLAEAQSRGLVPVLSNEALCGQPISGGRFTYGKYVVERLHETFPNARILIVVREQRASLLSLYREYIANGFCGDLAQFIGRPMPAIPDRPPQRVGAKGLGLAFKRACNRVNFGKADWARPRQSLAVRVDSTTSGWLERRVAWTEDLFED